MDGLLAKLAQISDPDHSEFRKHLMKEYVQIHLVLIFLFFSRQVDSFVSPSQEAINDVTKWLISHGIDKENVIFSDAKDYIKIALPVKTAQSLLDTTFSVFQHVHSQTKIIRALRYSLPASITKHIDFVQPTTMFANIHESDPEKLLPQRIRLGNDSEDALLGNCLGFRMNIDCIKQYYNMNYVPSSPKSKLGVTGYLGEYANYNDLTTFATNFLGGVPATFQVESGMY
jgi:tripeptidyl-peptidase-1